MEGIFLRLQVLISQKAYLSKLSVPSLGFCNLDFGNFGIDGPFLIGEVILADSFGNIITNIPEVMVFKFSTFGSQVEVNGRRYPLFRLTALSGRKSPLLS